MMQLSLYSISSDADMEISADEAAAAVHSRLSPGETDILNGILFSLQRVFSLNDISSILHAILV